MGGCPTDDILQPGGRYIRNLYLADCPAAEACDKSLEVENDLPIARDQRCHSSNGRGSPRSPVLKRQKRAGPIEGLRLFIKIKTRVRCIESLG